MSPSKGCCDDEMKLVQGTIPDLQKHSINNGFKNLIGSWQ